MKTLWIAVVLGALLGASSVFAAKTVKISKAIAGGTSESKAIDNAKEDAYRLATEACEESPKGFWNGRNFTIVGKPTIQSNCIYNTPTVLWYGGCVVGSASYSFKYTCNE